MANDRDFLGKGLRFPVSVNLNGGVSSSALEENVRQSIFIILGTAPGERIYRPDFGCRIHDLMFEPNNAITAAAREDVYVDETFAAVFNLDKSMKEMMTDPRVHARIVRQKVRALLGRTKIPHGFDRQLEPPGTDYSDPSAVLAMARSDA